MKRITASKFWSLVFITALAGVASVGAFAQVNVDTLVCVSSTSYDNEAPSERKLYEYYSNGNVATEICQKYNRSTSEWYPAEVSTYLENGKIDRRKSYVLFEPSGEVLLKSEYIYDYSANSAEPDEENIYYAIVNGNELEISRVVGLDVVPGGHSAEERRIYTDSAGWVVTYLETCNITYDAETRKGTSVTLVADGVNAPFVAVDSAEFVLDENEEEAFGVHYELSESGEFVPVYKREVADVEGQEGVKAAFEYDYDNELNDWVLRSKVEWYEDAHTSWRKEYGYDDESERLELDEYELNTKDESGNVVNSQSTYYSNGQFSNSQIAEYAVVKGKLERTSFTNYKAEADSSYITSMYVNKYDVSGNPIEILEYSRFGNASAELKLDRRIVNTYDAEGRLDSVYAYYRALQYDTLYLAVIDDYDYDESGRLLSRNSYSNYVRFMPYSEEFVLVFQILYTYDSNGNVLRIAQSSSDYESVEVFDYAHLSELDVVPVTAAPVVRKVSVDSKVYDLAGRYVGTDVSRLQKGVYVSGGRLIMVK